VEGLRLTAGPSGQVPNGGSVLRQFGYDMGGRLVEVADEAGHATTYTVDAQSRITSWTDRSGYRFGYIYDEHGRVERTEGDGGILSGSFEYDPERRVTVYTDSLGASTAYHYDQRGNVVRTVDALGGATVREYDRHGLLVSLTDPLGAVTAYERDGHGEVTRIIRADGSTIAFEVDKHGDTKAITGPDGARWECRYDERGNLIAEIDPAGATSSYTYIEDGPTSGIGGRLASVTDALGATTTFETDRAGLPVAITDLNGGIWRAERTVRGMASVVTDPLGNATVTSFDVRDLPVRQTGPDGAIESWTYDAAENLVAHTDAAGNTTRFEHGPFQKMTARTDPDGTRYSFSYDTELRLLAVTNPRDLTWSYARDAVGRITAETDFNGRRLEYHLDAAGRVIRRVNGAGEIVDLKRDALGRVVEQRTPRGRLSQFTYDPGGRLTSARNAAGLLEIERDQLGRVAAEVLNGHSLRSTYDALGRRVQRTTPSGRESTWSFDAVGNPAHLATLSGEIGFDHDQVGNETTRRIGPSAALTQSYDQAGRLIARNLLAVDYQQPRTSAQATLWRTVSSQSWTYRGDGTPKSATDSVTGTRRFALDARGRVAAVTGAGWTESYAYDENGNLQQASDTRRPDQDAAGERENVGTLQYRAGRTHFKYDDQHRLATRTVRTLSGQSKTTRFNYDQLDRMIRAELPDGSVWEYFYDALGRRFSKRRLDAEGRPVEETRFTWDGMTLAEQEHFKHDDQIVTITGWDHEPGSYTPLTQHRRRFHRDTPQDEIDHEFHAIVTDLVGTPVELVTETGVVAWRTYQSMWGGLVGNAVDRGSDLECPLRFPGQYHDAETGLNYNNQRYYDPETARYTTPDPLGLAPSANNHAYVDNPLTLLDPLGLNCASEIGTKVDYEDESNPLVKAVRDRRKADAEAQGLTYGKGANYASARLSDGSIITGRSGGKWHSEEDLLSQLKDGQTIKEIYSERAPCANKCRALVEKYKVSWSYEWNGADAKATTAIRANTNKLLKGAINKMFSGG
jgi:RHS repeat-associated protein